MSNHLFGKLTGGAILTTATFAGLMGAGTTAAHASVVAPSTAVHMYAWDGDDCSDWDCGGYAFRGVRFWRYATTTTTIAKRRVYRASYSHRRYRPVRRMRYVGRVHRFHHIRRVAHVHHYRPYRGHAVRRYSQTYFKRVHTVYRSGFQAACWSCW